VQALCSGIESRSAGVLVCVEGIMERVATRHAEVVFRQRVQWTLGDVAAFGDT
jgi:hypothetical protein